MTPQEFVHLYKTQASAYNAVARLLEQHINSEMSMDEVRERLGDMGDEARLGAPYGQLQYEVYFRALNDLGTVK